MNTSPAEARSIMMGALKGIKFNHGKLFKVQLTVEKEVFSCNISYCYIRITYS